MELQVPPDLCIWERYVLLKPLGFLLSSVLDGLDVLVMLESLLGAVVEHVLKHLAVDV